MPPTWIVDEVENGELRMKGEIEGGKRGEDWRRIGGWLEEPWGTLGSLWNYFGGALDIEMLKY